MRGRSRAVAAFFLVQWISAAAAFAADSNLQIRLVTDEADAALAILGERQATGAVKPESWERLFKSEGFIRLKKRSESFGAKDVEQGFREFLTSDEPLAHLAELRAGVDTWRQLDATAAARRAAAYLPAGQRLRATIYPVIKRSTNSFVFEVKKDPALFMYIEAKSNPAKLENTLAHELHHVGISGCPEPAGLDKLPAAHQRAVEELGAFGEGLAMLAAAGGPDVHPHATSDAGAWLVWERDLANFNTDLRRIESFFRDVLAGRISGDEENKKLFEFIDAEDVPQGGFYTVGWKMGAMVERARGRDALVKVLCDPRALLTAYNEVAAQQMRKDGENLALWSPEFLQALSTGAPLKPAN